MTKLQARLRLISFDYDDYSIAKSLVTPDKDLLAVESSQALSLYFHWPEYRSALSATNRGTCNLACELDYDQDARMPDELFVRFSQKLLPDSLTTGKQLTVRFEVFRNAYEIESSIVSLDRDPASGGHLCIIEMPTTLRKLVHRRLPRLTLTENEMTAFGQVTWSQGSDQTAMANVTEIGLASIAIVTQSPIEGRGFIQFGTERFDAEVLRHTGAASVIQPLLRTAEDFGRYFDLYCKVAYPMLVRRPDLPYEKLIELYDKTGYFSKFEVGEGQSERKNLLASEWRKIDQSFHQTTADYTGIDGDGSVSGTSGIGLAFVDKNTHYWALHQLCAVTDPNLLELTGALYCWRAEYLSARPEKLNAIGWFDSRSRWLERIYVKFCLNLGSNDRLHAVSVTRLPCNGDHATSHMDHSMDIQSLKIGDITRYVIASDSLIGGVAPRFFNASGILDSIVAVAQKPDSAKIEQMGRALAQMVGRPVALEVTQPKESEVALVDAEPVTDVDRYFVIPKDELVPFLASVEHSIAVTYRKRDGGRRVP